MPAAIRCRHLAGIFRNTETAAES